MPHKKPTSQPLPCPPVPVPPQAPQRLSKQTWHEYATNFATYLHAFHTFNSAMLQHFDAREKLAQQKMAQGMQWLEATGDVSAGGMQTGPTGFGGYAREVKEDVRVREVWGIGCERHTDAVKSFGDVREKVRRLVVGGGLVER